MNVEATAEVSLREEYLHLIQESLIGALNLDRFRPVYHLEPWWFRPIRAFLDSHNLDLVCRVPVAERAVQREGGIDSPLHADTLIGRKRMQNLRSCVESVLDNDVAGDFIETGVWRGGACIYMRAILYVRGVTDRNVWVADSFEGLPKPDTSYPADADDRYWMREDLRVSMEEVQQNFRKYGLLDDQVRFLKGWFKDTLPLAPIEKLAILRLDGDMYSSTIEALNALYDRVSPGGYVIVDDYALKGAREATDFFRRERGISSPLHEIDWTGVYWQKSA